MVRVNRVRRIIRKIDPWTVLKVTLVLNFVVALTVVLGFSIMWVFRNLLTISVSKVKGNM